MCIPETGKCFTCNEGMYGAHCDKTCPCENNQCIPMNGSCICDSGWFGEKCDKKCSPGKYGRDCKNNCSCQNYASCHHVQGVCTCSFGWTGKTCDISLDQANEVIKDYLEGY